MSDEVNAPEGCKFFSSQLVPGFGYKVMASVITVPKRVQDGVSKPAQWTLVTALGETEIRAKTEIVHQAEKLIAAARAKRQ